MASQSQNQLTLELWFEDADGGVQLTKSKLGEAITDRYSDDQPIPWTASVMAHMWYFVMCARDRKPDKNHKRDLRWEPVDPGSPMSSIHEAAPKKLQWRDRFLGDVWIQELLMLKHIHGKPHRRLNEELVPQDRIKVYLNDKRVLDIEELNVIAIMILNQFNEKQASRRRQVAANSYTEALEKKPADIDFNAANAALVFKVDWTEPPYSTMTLHVDQPLFEDCPGEWFRRGEDQSGCPKLYSLLLTGPGIQSVSRQSPYELLIGKALLAQYDVVVSFIQEALKAATGIQDVLDVSRTDDHLENGAAGGKSKRVKLYCSVCAHYFVTSPEAIVKFDETIRYEDIQKDLAVAFPCPRCTGFGSTAPLVVIEVEDRSAG